MKGRSRNVLVEAKKFVGLKDVACFYLFLSSIRGD